MENRIKKLLENWVKASMDSLYIPPDRPDLTCYGTGYNHWGVQTHQKAFCVFATLAAKYNKELIDISTSMLRFSLESHIEGSYNCTDGTKWGHTWISGLGIERMMHSVEAIFPYLTDRDKSLLEKVLISESNWLVDNYDIVAGEIFDNKPESNIWNGAILYRTAMMYPNASRAEEYERKATAFFLNGISVPSDKYSNEVYNGERLSEIHRGANFFESYALNHHGYLNVGYMVICLSNIAMLHFSYKQRGISAPKAIYLHVKELWQLIKTCTFPDGRLIRIGGDTRVRYCYCQDYLIPTWLFIKEYLGDNDCDEFLKNWLSILEKETLYNGSGLFLSERIKGLEKVSPTYYTRLESDRSISLTYPLFWNSEPKRNPTSVLKSWHDNYHGGFINRGKTSIVSWAWRGAEGPVGLCVPLSCSDLAEWQLNMAGRIEGIGNLHTHELLDKKDYMFNNGFMTIGATAIENRQFVAEGQPPERIAVSKIVFVSLPDQKTVVVMQYARAEIRCYLKNVKGMYVHIPNDIFNNNKREYSHNNGRNIFESFVGESGAFKTGSSWLTVDDKLGIASVYGGNIIINRVGKRQIGIKGYEGRDVSHGLGMLYTDEICTNCSTTLQSYDKDTVLIDSGFVVSTDTNLIKNHGFTSVKLDGECRRGMNVTDSMGNDYVVIADFGKTSAQLISKDPTLLNLN